MCSTVTSTSRTLQKVESLWLLSAWLLCVGTGPAGKIRQGTWALSPGEEKHPAWKQSKEGPGAQRRHTYLICPVQRREIVPKCLPTMCQASSHLVSQQLWDCVLLVLSPLYRWTNENRKVITSAHKSQKLESWARTSSKKYEVTTLPLPLPPWQC